MVIEDHHHFIVKNFISCIGIIDFLHSYFIIWDEVITCVNLCVRGNTAHAPAPRQYYNTNWDLGISPDTFPPLS
jgi:hypothetical protein